MIGSHFKVLSFIYLFVLAGVRLVKIQFSAIFIWNCGLEARSALCLQKYVVKREAAGMRVSTSKPQAYGSLLENNRLLRLAFREGAPPSSISTVC